ncbi:MAG: DUF3307 domain-containing protein [Clostridiaceae bacterium]|nr:DUF3307 domain-containing protein [Clostridiaceae bacterium]
MILLISHLLGDYYLQTKQMSELKEHKKFKKCRQIKDMKK